MEDIVPAISGRLPTEQIKIITILLEIPILGPDDLVLGVHEAPGNVKL